MKAFIGTAVALGLVAFASAPAFAQCASKHISADTGTMTPIVTADTVAAPAGADDKS